MKWDRRSRFAEGCLAGLATGAAITACAFPLHLNLATTACLYLVAVVSVSVVWGFWEASITSLAAVIALNYFFAPPVFSMRVEDPQNLVDLVAFECTALVVGRLSTRVRQQERRERAQRAELEKLHELSRRILLLDRRTVIGPQIVAVLHEVFRLDVALFDGGPIRLDTTVGCSPELQNLARSTYVQGAPVAPDDGQTWTRPLRLGLSPVGAIAMRGPELSATTVDSIASLTAIALERARSFDKESRAESAHQTEQLRSAVLDALGHAFKTPLTAIRTASFGLIEVGRLEAHDLELAKLIDAQAEHLAELTSNLLRMARLDSAEIRLKRRSLPVLTLLEEVVARYRPVLNGRTILLRDHTRGTSVYADRELLAAALDQLVDNASKYSTPASPITIWAEERRTEVVIGVRNLGTIIRDADRERVFDRFYRGNETRYRAQGSGLGLSIAKRAVEAHGGHIWLESDECEGTVFFLGLPGETSPDL